MGIEGIGSRTMDTVQNMAAVSSQRQSTDAPARVREVEAPEKDAVAKEGFAGEKEGEGQKVSTPMDSETMKRKINEINKKLNNTECQYGIHEETQRVTLKLIDKETKEVLREFPAEKTLEMIAKAWEMAGLLMDEKR